MFSATGTPQKTEEHLIGVDLTSQLYLKEKKMEISLNTEEQNRQKMITIALPIFKTNIFILFV